MDYIQIIAGVIIPFIISKFDNLFPSNKTLKYLVVLLVCFLGAIAVEFINGSFTGIGWDIFPLVAQIATTAQLIYITAIKK